MHIHKAPNLTQHPPRSPRERIGGYVILGRTTDKARAKLRGEIGEYRYHSPLDNLLFGFAGVTGDDFLAEVEKGSNDHGLTEWISSNGTRHTSAEVDAWSDQMEKLSLLGHPELEGFFTNECDRLGLDSAKVSLFDMLEADDRATFDLAAR